MNGNQSNPINLLKAACLECGNAIPSPRRFKGRIVQKFCSNQCRANYHNKPRTRGQIKAFVEELNALMRKYQLTNEDLDTSKTS